MRHILLNRRYPRSTKRTQFVLYIDKKNDKSVMLFFSFFIFRKVPLILS
jgi:hypothetical protein